MGLREEMASRNVRNIVWFGITHSPGWQGVAGSEGSVRSGG